MEKLLEAPVFKPSKEEFEDPISFIKSIRSEAEKSGIARIVPPNDWKPPFSIDTKKIKFHTRLQDLNKLSAESRLSKEFAETVRKFNFLNGTPMVKVSEVDQKIRWRGLYKAVAEYGGSSQVSGKKAWSKIGQKAAVTIKGAQTDGEELCTFYESVLLAYENLLRQRQQVVKQEEGSSSTTGKKQSSSTEQEATDMETDNDTSDIRKDAKRQRRSSTPDKLEETNSDQSNSEKEAKKRKATPIQIQVGLKFWRYFPDLDKSLYGQIKSVDKTKASTRYVVEYSNDDEKKEGATLESVARTQLEILVANGSTAESARAAFTGEICEDCSRSVPGDQAATCAACSCHYHPNCARAMHLNTLTASGPKEHGDFKIVEGHDWYCADCVEDVAKELFGPKPDKKVQTSKFSGGRLGKDRLERPSTGRNHYQYGFDDGEWHTVSSFRSLDKKFFNAHIKGTIGDFPEKGTKGVQRAYERKLEEHFWNILGNEDGAKHEGLVVQYGSDLDTGVLGSGFPRNIPPPGKRLVTSKGSKRAATTAGAEAGGGPDNKKDKDTKNKEAEEAVDPSVLAKHLISGWNLNNLPAINGSVLRHLHGAVKGVMIPWLYMGMTFSTFCWHTEDHNLYSINFHHWGRPKVWYGVRGGDAPKFDAVVRDMFPELFEKNPDLLLQLVTMVNPLELVKRGLTVVKTVQRPGEFIVTFPQAYHAGFNMGLNCAEAVNFATPDWLPWGVHALNRYASFQRTPVFSHDALVLAIGRSLVFSPPGERAECLPYALQQLEKILERNRATREAAFQAGVIDDVKPMSEFPGRRKLKRRCRGSLAPNYIPEDSLASDEYAEFLSSSNGGGGLRCNECNQYCFLEVVACNKCGPRRVNCADHLETTCLCQDATTLTLYQRFEDDTLEDLIARMRVRRDQWECWKANARLLKERLERTWSDLGKKDLDGMSDRALAQASTSCLIKLTEVQTFIREGEALGVGFDELMPFKKVLSIIEEWIIKCQVLLPGLDKPLGKEGLRKITFGQALALLKEGLMLPLRPEQELTAAVQILSQACEMWSSICEHFSYGFPKDLQECIDFCIALDSSNEDKLDSKRIKTKNLKESENSDYLGSLVNRILDCQVIMPEIKDIQKKYC